ncbi:cupin domain [Bradyrhizobium macuxiense]|uniref:Cupin domain n=1 Tax=Bradyrhizobium macuxiense TaxID=1755647 RepID=A0A560L6I9_9BRAD|nr:cupin domain [Bradyrhizobium macuxiense]
MLLGLAVIAFAGAGAAFVGAGAALAQQSGIKRTPLQKVDLPAGYNTVTAIAEVPAGGASGRHSHPGAETGYVLEGELELVIDGKPPLTLKAGDSYQIPEGGARCQAFRRQAAQGDRRLRGQGRRALGETSAVNPNRLVSDQSVHVGFRCGERQFEFAGPLMFCLIAGI